MGSSFVKYGLSFIESLKSKKHFPHIREGRATLANISRIPLDISKSQNEASVISLLR